MFQVFEVSLAVAAIAVIVQLIWPEKPDSRGTQLMVKRTELNKK